MTNYNREGTRDLFALVATTGTRLDPVQASGITLANNTDYYLPLGDELTPAPSECSLSCVHIKWDAAFVGVFTIETTNFPLRKGGAWTGPADVSDFDTAKGNWIQENPSTAYISVTSTDGSTGNAVASAATVTVSGGTAGGCMIHIGNFGSRRVRIKAHVTTGGVVRFSQTGKNAA